jgi:hypothetical protein
MKSDYKEKINWDKFVYWFYWPYRFWFNHVRYFHKEIKWFFQRGWRGYADCDVWGLDGYLISWLPKALRHLAKYNHGCPPYLYDDQAKDDKCHKWKEILEKMALGFELQDKWDRDYVAVVGDTKNGKEYYDFKDPEWVKKFNAKEKEVEKTFNEAMDLFIKYFHNLWD